MEGSIIFNKRRSTLSAIPPVGSPPKPSNPSKKDPLVEAKAKQDGQNEAIKEDTKEEVASKRKMADLVEQSSIVLLKAKTVFPFTLFVHDLTIDVTKINFVFRQFFYSEDVHSVLIKDVSDVIVTTSLFFATLKVIDTGFTEGTIEMNYLTRDDALKARRIIQGLVACHHKEIDLSQFNKEELLQKVEDMGEVKEVDIS